MSQLDVPRPFDVRELVHRLGRRRGRPIELRPVHTPPDTPSGVWIAARTRDYIFYEADTSSLHQEHIILHELGHLVCGHDNPAQSAETLARLLLPTLDPKVVRSVLGRTAYSEPDEAQAELFASLVLEQAGRIPVTRRRSLSRDQAAVLDHLSTVLEGNRRHNNG